MKILNPLNVIKKRKLSIMPKHFSKVKIQDFDLSQGKLENWITSKLNGRYSIVKIPAVSDTSGINLPPIPKLKPEPGHYLVTGLHATEDKANQQIKEMYLKNVIAFKFYDPRVKSYYIFVRKYTNEKDANKGEFYFEGQVPRVWIREIRE